MHAAARANPEWIHIGAGNIFRAFVASFVQDLLDAGRLEKGLIVAEGCDCEIVDAAYRGFDNLCLSVTLKDDGFEGARGVMFADRETVDKVERMKVCTCPNPLHTAMSVFGCLPGYTLIPEEMKDPDLRKLIGVIGFREGLPVVVDPGVLNPREFIDTVVSVRLPDVFMPDSPQHIAADTSQKLAIRFGETVKAYRDRPDLNVSGLKIIPPVFAGWLRYSMGIDDGAVRSRPATPRCSKRCRARSRASASATPLRSGGR